MEYAAVILADTARQLQRIFETDEELSPDLDELHHKVDRMVLYLLRKDLNRLLHLLYRIDVNERQVKKAMQAPAEDEVATQITHLIIKRELQKAQTRFIYSRKDKN